MRSIFSNTKSKIRSKREGHIYKIECSDPNCEKTYIGQSSRTGCDINNGIIGERVKEHMRDFKKAKLERNIILAEREEEIAAINNSRTRSKTKDLNDLIEKHQKDDEEYRYKTACVDHALKEGHRFGYQQTAILHKENNFRKRLALESIYIFNEGQNACNFKVDTQYLNQHTKQIVNAYTFYKSK